MKKLLSSEDSGVGLSGTNDPIMDMVVKAFSSLMMLAVVIDNKNEEEQKEVISEMADSRKVELTLLMPHMKACAIIINESNKAVLQADNGAVQVSRELSASELSRLSATLNNPELSEESKRMRVAGMVNTIVLSQQASQNFEQGMSGNRVRTSKSEDNETRDDGNRIVGRRAVALQDCTPSYATGCSVWWRHS